jgi:hypothetical protein
MILVNTPKISEVTLLLFPPDTLSAISLKTMTVYLTRSLPQNNTLIYRCVPASKNNPL